MIGKEGEREGRKRSERKRIEKAAGRRREKRCMDSI